MNRYKLSILFLIGCFYIYQAYGADSVPQPNKLSKFYAKITDGPLLTDPDASPHYQKLFRQALKDFGVKDAEKVPVKKILKASHYGLAYNPNGLDYLICGVDGIWINEEVLNSKSTEWVEYVAYHESAHYKLEKGGILQCKWHGKQHLAAGLCAIVGIPYIRSRSSIRKDIIYLLTAYGSSSLLQLYTEKEADYEAVKLLAKLGKHDVIAAGIQNTPYDGKLLQKKYDALIAKKQNKSAQIKSKL